MKEFREIKLKDYYPCLGCGAKTEPWGIWDTAQESQYCRSCWEGRTLPSEEPRRKLLTCCNCRMTHLVALPYCVDQVDAFICKTCSRNLEAEVDLQRPKPVTAPRTLREKSIWSLPLVLGIFLAFVAVVVAAVSVAVVAVRWAFGI